MGEYTRTRLSRVVLRFCMTPHPPSLCCRRHRGGRLAWRALFRAAVANLEARAAGRRGEKGIREKDGAPGKTNNSYCPPPWAFFYFVTRSAAIVLYCVVCSLLFVPLFPLVNAHPSLLVFLFLYVALRDLPVTAANAVCGIITASTPHVYVDSLSHYAANVPRNSP